MLVALIGFANFIITIIKLRIIAIIVMLRNKQKEIIIIINFIMLKNPLRL